MYFFLNTQRRKFVKKFIKFLIYCMCKGGGGRGGVIPDPLNVLLYTARKSEIADLQWLCLRGDQVRGKGLP